MECDCSSHTIYEDFFIRRRQDYSAGAPRSFGAVRDVLRRHDLRGVQKLLDEGFRSPRIPTTTRLRCNTLIFKLGTQINLIRFDIGSLRFYLFYLGFRVFIEN